MISDTQFPSANGDAGLILPGASGTPAARRSAEINADGTAESADEKHRLAAVSADQATGDGLSFHNSEEAIAPISLNAECGVRNDESAALCRDAATMPLPNVLAGPMTPSALRTDRPAKLEAHWRSTYNAYQELLARAERKEIPRPSYPKAAQMLGVPVATLHRIITKYADRAGGLAPAFENCGARSPLEWVLQDALFCARLEEVYLSTIGSSSDAMTARAARTGRRTAFIATALTVMAEEPECPVALQPILRAGKFPLFLRRHLRRITPELEQKLRGPKHFQLNGITSRRDLTVRFPDGTRGDLPAGFKWVFDDMSVNQPFWHTVDGRILFSRQGLYAIDQRSLRWLGHMLVMRPREAYRSEDILRFLRGLFTAYQGKPDVIVFEQGVWKARKIHGFRLNTLGDAVPEEIERPGMDDDTQAMLSGGLEQIGIKVIFAKSAHGKIIETKFNALQRLIATKATQYVNIGRHAGEFEIAGKRLAQVRSGARLPSQVGFAPARELSAIIDQVFAFDNGKVNSRGEIADEVWTHDLSGRPLQANRNIDAAQLLPNHRPRLIQGGCVSLTVAGIQHDYRAPWMVELGAGYRVYCRFDETEPTLGAAIYNRETGANNVNGWKDGQFIGFAAWEMPAPSLNVPHGTRGIEPRDVEDYYGPGAEDRGVELRKAQEKIVATFASYLPRPGLPAVKHVEVRKGDGRTYQDGSDPMITTKPVPAEPPKSDQVQRRRGHGVQEDEFKRQQARLAKDEERQRRIDAAKLQAVED